MHLTSPEGLLPHNPGLSIFSPTFDPADLASPLNSNTLGSTSGINSGGETLTPFTLRPSTLPIPQNQKSNLTVPLSLSEAQPAAALTLNNQLRSYKPPLAFLLQKGYLQPLSELSIDGTAFKGIVQANGRVVDSDGNAYGFDEWLNNCWKIHQKEKTEKTKNEWTWENVRVNGGQTINSLYECFDSLSGEAIQQNKIQTLNPPQQKPQTKPQTNIRTQPNQPNQSQPTTQSLQTQKKSEFRAEDCPYAIEGWELRNSIVYKDFVLNVVYNTQKDALFYSYDMIKSFLPPIAREFLEKTNFFTSAQMFRCNEYKFFQFYHLNFTSVISCEGVESLYATLRTNSSEDVRRSSIFLEEPIVLFKSAEEKRMSSVFLPRDHWVRNVSLYALFSGAEEAAFQSLTQTQTNNRHSQAIDDPFPRKYRCECGEAFSTSQSKAGHSHFCKVHLEMKKKKNSWKTSNKAKFGDKLGNDEISYKCDCGKSFPSSQAKAGHCHFCPIHQKLKQTGKPTISNKQVSSSALLQSFGAFANVNSVNVNSFVVTQQSADSNANTNKSASIQSLDLSTSQNRNERRNPNSYAFSTTNTDSLPSLSSSLLVSPAITSSNNTPSVIDAHSKLKREREDSLLSPLTLANKQISPATLGAVGAMPFSSCVLSPRTMALYTVALEEMNGIDAPPPLVLSPENNIANRNGNTNNGAEQVQSQLSLRNEQEQDGNDDFVGGTTK